MQKYLTFNAKSFDIRFILLLTI